MLFTALGFNPVRAEPVPFDFYERWWFGDKNYGPDHGKVEINKIAKNKYSIVLSAPRFQACLYFKEDACSPFDRNGAHALSEWKLLFGKSNPAKAVLSMSDTVNHTRQLVALEILSQPVFISDTTIYLEARFNNKASGHLEEFVKSVSTEGTVKKMPLGLFDFPHVLVVDNNSKVPSGYLTAELQYKLSDSVKVVKCTDKKGKVTYAQDCSQATKSEPVPSEQPQKAVAVDLTQADPITGPSCWDSVDLSDAIKAQTWAKDQISAAESAAGASYASVKMSTLISADTRAALTDNQLQAIARQYVLPCKADLASPAASTKGKIPANVAVITSILGDPAATSGTPWFRMTRAIGGGTNPAPTGLTYANFLSAAARMPFFCGEQGIHASVKEACMREIAAVFAHGAQETGKNSATDYWNEAFYALREGSCNTSAAGCPQYELPVLDGPCTYGRNCGSAVAFYGRGAHQLTGWMNYSWFSAGYLGDGDVLVQNPDHVASNGYLVFASAIWFDMVSQGPKPSMHEVLTGIYKPSGSPPDTLGIKVATDGTVYDKFMATISVINGAVECNSNWAAEKDRTYEETGKRRINSYFSLLVGTSVTTTVGGAPVTTTYPSLGATLTSDESAIKDAYAKSPTGCTIKKGNVWTDTSLVNQSPTWIKRSWNGQSCVASLSTDTPKALLSAESSLTLCAKQDDVAGGFAYQDTGQKGFVWYKAVNSTSKLSSNFKLEWMPMMSFDSTAQKCSAIASKDLKWNEIALAPDKLSTTGGTDTWDPLKFIYSYDSAAAGSALVNQRGSIWIKLTDLTTKGYALLSPTNLIVACPP